VKQGSAASRAASLCILLRVAQEELVRQNARFPAAARSALIPNRQLGQFDKLGAGLRIADCHEGFDETQSIAPQHIPVAQVNARATRQGRGRTREPKSTAPIAPMCVAAEFHP
jgi:hypothetical protein